MTQLQGWTVIFRDHANDVRFELQAHELNIAHDFEPDYDAPHSYIIDNNPDVVPTFNFPLRRFGTMTVTSFMQNHETRRLYDYINTLNDAFNHRIPSCSIDIRGTGNSASFANAIITSVDWQSAGDDIIKTEIQWRFSNSTVLAVPPPELRRMQVPLQNLDWRSYGF